jgi:hypothetical protein
VSFDIPPPDPTNPDLILGLFHYLATQGVVRDPLDDTYQSTRPPLWLEPRLGTPAPGPVEGLGETEISPLTPDGPGLQVGVESLPGIPSGPYEGFLRSSHVQFVVRAERADIAKQFEQAVRALLNDKRGWEMYNVPVNESLLFRDLQPISKDNLAYTYTFEYAFSLWGPFTPVGP